MLKKNIYIDTQLMSFAITHIIHNSVMGSRSLSEAVSIETNTDFNSLNFC